MGSEVCSVPAESDSRKMRGMVALKFKKYVVTRYTVCPRRNGQNFGRVFLMLKYTDITQNTYNQSGTVTEIMAREV